MKVIQYNQDSASAVIVDDTNSAALDVSGMGPDSIAIQLTITDSSVNSTSCQLQGSIDGVNYFDLGSATNITADAVLSITAEPVYYKFYRMKYLTTPVKASLVNQSLTYTAVDYGVEGDSITITLVDPPENNVPLSISVVGSDIVVTLATNGSSAITSTGNDVKAALNLDVDAAALILVSGSNASPLTALTETPLTGADGYFTVVERKLVYGSRI